ncbi:MAG: hypothetical protein R3264_01780 [Anaerolineae bacterium]|nr:hypothetical protein [Anaerolineae bacterium]
MERPNFFIQVFLVIKLVIIANLPHHLSLQEPVKTDLTVGSVLTAVNSNFMTTAIYLPTLMKKD